MFLQRHDKSRLSKLFQTFIRHKPFFLKGYYLDFLHVIFKVKQNIKL